MNQDFDDDWDEGDVWDQEDDCLVDCPHCGESIYDDVDQCPYCRMYLSSSDFHKPVSRWWMVAVVLVIVGLLLPLLGKLLLLAG